MEAIHDTKRPLVTTHSRRTTFDCIQINMTILLNRECTNVMLNILIYNW